MENEPTIFDDGSGSDALRSPLSYGFPFVTPAKTSTPRMMVCANSKTEAPFAFTVSKTNAHLNVFGNPAEASTSNSGQNSFGDINNRVNTFDQPRATRILQENNGNRLFGKPTDQEISANTSSELNIANTASSFGARSYGQPSAGSLFEHGFEKTASLVSSRAPIANACFSGFSAQTNTTFSLFGQKPAAECRSPTVFGATTSGATGFGSGVYRWPPEFSGFRTFGETNKFSAAAVPDFGDFCAPNAVPFCDRDIFGNSTAQQPQKASVPIHQHDLSNFDVVNEETTPSKVILNHAVLLQTNH